MHSRKHLIWAILLILPIFACTIVHAAIPINLPENDLRNIADEDDLLPEADNRVARISFLRGDVRIRRAGSQDWEQADLNLPVVEGDDIATDANGRCEIQFNSSTHMRLAANSVLKLTGLKDNGIAVSLPQGTLSLRVSEFDKSRSYFEIDAPRTTVSVERAGNYRIDAGEIDNDEVRISVTQDGEARVYSDNSGFTLRSGRRATLAIAGNYAGEWQTADAGSYLDAFDKWSLDRDEAVAKLLRDAHYDKYYDRDMYGAEDLSDYGEWIHTRTYGYVWRPFPAATGFYRNWSPYRYGHWRWVPPYGWTWINDEPWGWATYHYGRWVWADGNWLWSPYGYYRNQRSWWRPALVVITILNNNVCWYPLPYHHRYRQYNARHGGPRHPDGHAWNPPPANPAATPTPAGPASYPLLTADRRRRRAITPPLMNLPPTAVVSVQASEFGRGKGNLRTPPLAIANAAISKMNDVDEVSPLPTFKSLGGRISREISAETPPIAVKAEETVRTGASERRPNVPLDSELRTRRVFGDRVPLPDKRTEEPVRPESDGSVEPRRTGAVSRPAAREARDDQPVRQPPTRVPRDSPGYDKPTPVRNEAPTYSAPSRQNTPKYEPPRERERPRYDPPTRSEPPPRVDPPTKSDPPPKSDPPTKSDPPKSDGPVDRKSKDGR